MKIGIALVLDRFFQVLVIFILNYLVCRVVDLVQTRSYIGYITFLKSEHFLSHQQIFLLRCCIILNNISLLIYGPGSPKPGAPSGCEWRRGSPGIDSSCKRVE